MPWSVRLRGALTRRARGLGLLLICCAGFLALLVPARSATAPDHDIVVAAHDLPLGAVLEDSDLRTVRVAAEGAPAPGVGDPAAALGKRLAVPLRSGEFLPEHALVGTDLAEGLPSGQAAVGVRVRDPQTLQLLSPGSAVRVLGRTSEGQKVDVPGVLLWVPGSERSAETAAGFPGGAGGSSGSGQELALVAVKGARAPDLALAAGEVAIAVTGPESSQGTP